MESKAKVPTVVIIRLSGCGVTFIGEKGSKNLIWAAQQMIAAGGVPVAEVLCHG